jgi:hypothetical protein
MTPSGGARPALPGDRRLSFAGVHPEEYAPPHGFATFYVRFYDTKHSSYQRALGRLDEATSRMVKPLAKGLTSGMKRMADAGLDHLICRPIKRLDEDRKPYDVTEALIEEMLFFPFAPKDDLVDAASRVYDMGIVLPDMFEDDDAKLLNARDWVDA